MSYITIQMLALIIGFESALFLFAGSVAISPHSIIDLSSPKPHLEMKIVRRLSAHRACTLVGSMLLGLCFLLQVMVLILGPTMQQLGDSWIAAVFVGVLVLLGSIWLVGRMTNMLINQVKHISRQRFEKILR